MLHLLRQHLPESGQILVEIGLCGRAPGGTSPAMDRIIAVTGP
ncbi:MAG: hypothetical protein V4724_07965 [Pseudomonadota bacterium]